jgi:KilA-N domain
MNFTKTTSEDFTIIKNGVDEALQIIRHDDTGYYNITKMAKMVSQLKRSQNEAMGYPIASPKLVADWLRNDSVQELFEACKQHIGNEVHYELKVGTPTRFAGTYIHRYLFDHAMSWLDKKYALKVSIILDTIHQEANRKIVKEKDDKIDELNGNVKELKSMVARMIRHAEDTSSKLDLAQQERSEILFELSDTKDELIDTKAMLVDVADELEDTKETLDEVNDKVELATDLLKTKSYHSTRDPSNEKLHHCFAATKITDKHGNIHVKFITGQVRHVDATYAKRLEDGHTSAISKFYNANGIDLRQNVNDEFIAKRKQVIQIENEKRAKACAIFNDELKKQIRDYNRLHKTHLEKNRSKRRFFSQEKRKTPKISKDDITVKFSKLSFVYTENPYISYDEVLQIIIDTNRITQESPLPSETSDDSSSE